MAIDSANAAYADEQAQREQLQDDWAREWEEAVYSLKEMIEHWGVPALYAALSLLPERINSLAPLPPAKCSDCQNWQAGTTAQSSGWQYANAVGILRG